MAEYIRKQYNTLKARIAEPRKFIQVLAGPRQVGKTTLVAQVVKDINVPFTLENADGIAPNNKEWIHQVWQSVRVNMQMHGHEEHLLVIDEVQKIENWSEFVKAEWDRDTLEGRQLKVVLLGSSRLMLRKGLTESLAGRFELNARFNDKADYDEGHEIFEELWRDAVVIADQTNVPFIRTRI